jgi:hypothetical protein
MTNPPAPLPSVAATRALRGLLLGTTCSLGLVLEDRRRRISTLRNRLKNAEKLKSHERYHAGGAAAILERFEQTSDPAWLPTNLPETMSSSALFEEPPLAPPKSSSNHAQSTRERCTAGPRLGHWSVDEITQGIRQAAIPGYSTWNSPAIKPFQSTRMVPTHRSHEHNQKSQDHTAPVSEAEPTSLNSTSPAIVSMTASTHDRNKRMTALTRDVIRAQESLKRSFIGCLDVLAAHRMHRQVIQAFLHFPFRQVPEPKLVGRLVAEAVRECNGLRAGEVFRKMRAMHESTKLRPGTIDMSGYQIILRAHWKATRDFEGTAAMFSEIRQSPRLRRRSQPVFDAMIAIALDAGKITEMNSYINTLIDIYPARAEDLRVLGVLALSMARTGDWEAVKSAFRAARDAKSNRYYSSDKAGKYLQPVVEEHCRGHGLAETVAWFKDLTGDLGIAPHPHTITFMSNRFGDALDHDGLFEWLEYCQSAGRPFGPAFTASILRNAWKRWGFSVPKLQMLYDEIQRLRPNSRDASTDMIMALAAARHKWDFSDGYFSPDETLNRGEPDASAATGVAKKRARWDSEVYLLMNQAAVRGDVGSVVEIYREALRKGMTPSEKCLRLAIRSTPSGSEASMQLVKDAHSAGLDVSRLVWHLLMLQTRRIDPTIWQGEVLSSLRGAVQKLEALGLPVDHETRFDMTTRTLLRGKSPAALQSVQPEIFNFRTQDDAPAYCERNFSLLLRTMALRQDAAGIRSLLRTVRNAPHTIRFRHKKTTISVLNKAEKLEDTPDAKAVIDALQEGLVMFDAFEQHFNMQKWMFKGKAGALARLDGDPVKEIFEERFDTQNQCLPNESTAATNRAATEDEDRASFDGPEETPIAQTTQVPSVKLVKNALALDADVNTFMELEKLLNVPAQCPNGKESEHEWAMYGVPENMTDKTIAPANGGVLEEEIVCTPKDQEGLADAQEMFLSDNLTKATTTLDEGSFVLDASESKGNEQEDPLAAGAIASEEYAAPKSAASKPYDTSTDSLAAICKGWQGMLGNPRATSSDRGGYGRITETISGDKPLPEDDQEAVREHRVPSEYMPWAVHVAQHKKRALHVGRKRSARIVAKPRPFWLSEEMRAELRLP